MKDDMKVPVVSGHDEMPDYVLVSEAARIIGCTNKRIYQFVKAGRLPARRLGRMLILPREEVENFRPGPSGRVRKKAPPWRTYRSRGKLLATLIDVKFRPGMQRVWKNKLASIKPEEYTFTANVARYFTEKGDTVRIILIWKNTEKPDDTTRQEDLRLFQQAFETILDWETATYSIDEDVVFHT